MAANSMQQICHEHCQVLAGCLYKALLAICLVLGLIDSDNEDDFYRKLGDLKKVWNAQEQQFLRPDQTPTFYNYINEKVGNAQLVSCPSTFIFLAHSAFSSYYTLFSRIIT